MKTIIEENKEYLAPTYNRFDVSIKEGRGIKVFDENGKEYYDFLSGVAVCSLGHSHPAIIKKIKEQSEKLIHISNLFYNEPQTELAKHLINKSFADKVFFTNSGTEAIEGAIKLTRKYFYDKGLKRQNRIIAMENSFHGRTIGALSATGQEKLKEGFTPLLDCFDFVKFNDIESFCKQINKQTAAVLIEPIQGEGGIIMPNPGYLKTLSKICEETGILLIFDEIQTGIGRTGKMFAYEHFGLEPDIMTLAKGLGGGLPIGAILAKENIMKSFTAGSHGSTFAGSPFVSAVSLEVLKTIEKDNLIKNAEEQGIYFKKKLIALSKRRTIIKEIRGMGLMIAIELRKKASPFVQKAFENGLLINSPKESTLRLLPPLIITKEDIDIFIERLENIFR